MSDLRIMKMNNLISNDQPEPCIADGTRCLSTIACGGFGYCRKRNEFGVPNDPYIIDTWKRRAAARKSLAEDTKMKLIFGRTERGFAKAEFKDRYGNECSIQKSSLATEDCLWLGCDHEIFDQNKLACGARMHLTQEMCATLAPVLFYFAKHGELPK